MNDLEARAEAAGVTHWKRYADPLHIQPRELPGGEWEWELPAGLNRDLYPKPPDPLPPPPEPTLFDAEVEPPSQAKKRTGKSKKGKPKRKASGT